MTERRARRKPGENRVRLLQAGLHEFGLYGYQGTSTARIAARAEVPQPHVYANFSGKPELFLACLDQAFELLSSASRHEASADLADSAASAASTASGELLIFQAIAAVRDPDHGALIRDRLAHAGFLEGARRDATILVAATRLARGAPEASAEGPR